MFRHIVLMVFVFLLAGCSTIEKGHFIAHRNTEYLSGVETGKLQLPPSFDQAEINDKYSIPPATGAHPTQPASIVPPGSSLDKK
jgi:uncharacterized lipoprotein